MRNTREIGNKAESLAKDHLRKLGYKILETNWHFGHLELDIIAQDNQELVIVEVKSRNSVRYEHPAEAVNNIKIKRIVEATDAYIQEKDIDLETRFDIVTVIFFKDNYELEHFKDAFYPTL